MWGLLLCECQWMFCHHHNYHHHRHHPHSLNDRKYRFHLSFEASTAGVCIISYAADPWTIRFGLQRSTYTRSFSTHTCTVFALRLGVIRCNRLMVCIGYMSLHTGNWSVRGFWYPQGGSRSWSQLPVATEGQLLYLSFGGVKSYRQVFDCMGVSAPNPNITQGSAVYCVRHLGYKDEPTLYSVTMLLPYVS